MMLCVLILLLITFILPIMEVIYQLQWLRFILTEQPKTDSTEDTPTVTPTRKIRYYNYRRSKNNKPLLDEEQWFEEYDNSDMIEESYFDRRPAKRSVKKLIKPLIEKPAKQSIEPLVKPLFEPLAKRSPKRSARRSVEPPTEQLVEQPTVVKSPIDTFGYPREKKGSSTLRATKRRRSLLMRGRSLDKRNMTTDLYIDNTEM